MLPSVVHIFDNSTGTRSGTPLFIPSPSSTFSNRESGIRNPNNHPISNHFHFSNRKYSAIFLDYRTTNVQPLHSNRYAAIKNPINPPHFRHFQFSNRYKTRLLRLERTNWSACLLTFLLRCLSPSESPCLRASVANLCDNGWLKLRLM
jgi:hypothetical protein